MGHSHHHEGVDGLLNLFTKANHDLTVVHHKLEKEFQQIYLDNVNGLGITLLASNWLFVTFLDSSNLLIS